jgi:hypothetical protein
MMFLKLKLSNVYLKNFFPVNEYNSCMMFNCQLKCRAKCDGEFYALCQYHTRKTLIYEMKKHLNFRNYMVF